MKHRRPSKMTDRQRRTRYAARHLVRALAVALVLAGLIAADRAGLFGKRPPPDADKYDGRSFVVVKVVDGDTIDLDVPDAAWDHTRVRLWGVDTPETVKENTPVQHFGPQASEFTRRTCRGKLVRIELDPRDTRDRYGRLLAYVYLDDGRMLNRVLVAGGYAYADPRFDHEFRGEFNRLQRDAMEGGRGLWRDATPADLPYYLRGLKLPNRMEQ